ncbi:glycosyl hydrolase family 28-related protein [Peribacillus frigoritolerans]
MPNGNGVNVLDFGAIGDGVADDTRAIQEAINYCSVAGRPTKVLIPRGDYKVTSPIVLTSSRQGLEIVGEGNRASVISPNHSGNVIEISSQGSKIRDLMIYTTGNFLKKYTGIYVLNVHSVSIDNVHIMYPKNGIILEGDVYYLNARDILILNYINKGIYLKRSINGAMPNSNTFEIKMVTSDNGATPGTIGVHIEGGILNEFRGGQISHSDIAFYLENANRNYFRNIWVEHTKNAVKAISGINFMDCHGLLGNILSEGAIIKTSYGEVSFYSFLPQKSPNITKCLKGLYFFNEGEGNLVIDKSGNQKHLILTGTPEWTDDGKWGKAVRFNNQIGNRILAPADLLDWSQPYTFGILAKIENRGNNQYPQFGLFIDGGEKYVAFILHSSYLQIVNHNNSLGTNLHSNQTVGYGAGSFDDFQWVFIYVDPLNNYVEVIDPTRDKPVGVNTTIPIPIKDSQTISKLYLSGRPIAVSNMTIGVMSMSVFYQRKLLKKEVLEIVNSVERPFIEMNDKIVKSTTLISPNGLSYKISVDETGQLVIIRV